MTYVSGTNKKIMTSAMMLKPAYRANAPVGVRAASIRGKVMDRTAAQKRQVATAHDIPTSR